MKTVFLVPERGKKKMASVSLGLQVDVVEENWQADVWVTKLKEFLSQSSPIIALSILSTVLERSGVVLVSVKVLS